MGWEDFAEIAGAALVSGYTAKKAETAQKKAAAGAGALSEKQYQQSRADQAPWMATGGGAVRELGALYGLPYAMPGAPAGFDNIAGQGNGMAPNALAQFGRGGDTAMAHVTPGETVVPQEVANRLPGGRTALARAFKDSGANPEQYVVGEQNSINPATGAPEFLYGGGTSEGGATGFGGGAGGDQDKNIGGYTSLDATAGMAGVGAQNPDPFGPNDWQTGAKYGMAIGGIPGAVAGGLWGGYNQGAFSGGTPSGLPNPQRDGRDGGYGNALAGYGGAPGGAPGGAAGGGALPNDYYSRENAMARFYESPDYNISFDEGAKALERSAAARGGLFSGNTGTALTRYGQDYGNRLYGQYANRLAALAGVGQTSVSNVGQLGASAAGQQGNAMMAGGQAGAQGWANLNNAIQGGIQNYATYAGIQ